jgi:predicted nuclease with TOPRIM domain
VWDAVYFWSTNNIMCFKKLDELFDKKNILCKIIENKEKEYADASENKRRLMIAEAMLEEIDKAIEQTRKEIMFDLTNKTR